MSVAGVGLSTNPAIAVILSELKSKNSDARDRGIKSLRSLVEGKIEERNGEDFTRLMNDLSRQLFELLKSIDIGEKVAGIMAIDEVSFPLCLHVCLFSYDSIRQFMARELQVY
jgi:hypothetical protein